MKKKVAYLILLLALAPLSTRVPCAKLPGLERVAYFLSETQGKLAFVIWTSLLAYLAYKKGYSWKGLIAEAVLLNLLVLLFKCVFHAPRPLASPQGFCDWENMGYPSGHTARTFWVALWLSELLPRYAPAFLLYALAVAWSRVELCKHFPLDTVGGLLLALLTFKLALELGGRKPVTSFSREPRRA